MKDRWQTILAVDFDKWAAATYAANFPGVDVRCAGVETILPELREGMADVVLGGPPCQPFSDAGDNEGENINLFTGRTQANKAAPEVLLINGRSLAKGAA